MVPENRSHGMNTIRVYNKQNIKLLFYELGVAVNVLASWRRQQWLFPTWELFPTPNFFKSSTFWGRLLTAIQGYCISSEHYQAGSIVGNDNYKSSATLTDINCPILTPFTCKLLRVNTAGTHAEIDRLNYH